MLPPGGAKSKDLVDSGGLLDSGDVIDSGVVAG